MRIPACFLLLALGSLGAADKPAPAITFAEIPSPAAARSVGASLTTGPDGTHWLSWVERGGKGANVLRVAAFDPAAKRFSPPHTIAADQTVTLNALDFPQLAIAAGGRMLAVWTDGHGGACQSESRDAGATWSAPVPWARDGATVEKFSFTTLADGRVLAAWLDGRGRQAGGKMQQLYARVIGESQPDTLVDGSVCDCCQTTLTAFPDGSALLAYRGRTDEEQRDIRVARWRGGSWSEPRPLNHDDWRIDACPVNGPRLASDGGRVAAAWFTAADNDPRVLATFSPDAGARFLMPLRIDRGRPAGQVDVALLHDGAFLVTWVETDGSVWLRRVSPDFTTDEPIAVAAAGAVPMHTFPRMALLRDYVGGTEPAQLLVAFATNHALRTRLITVPESDLLEAGKNCDCAPTAEELRGFPIRGTILETDSSRARVSHFAVPGIFEQGQREFRLGADVGTTLSPGRQFLGRIEQRDGQWWLFDIRLLATAPAR